MVSNDLRSAIIATAGRLGINPHDLATAISYETGGTFDPWKRGPTTKWGTHRGLIQWGEPQARQYGVTQSMPVADQVDAAGRYLADRGVRPGHGLLEIYSAINAGGVGDQYYGRSDAHAGGAQGTVRDKVNNQMAGHRQNAARLLGDGVPSVQPAALPSPAASQPDAPPPGVLAALAGGGEQAQPTMNPLLQALASVQQQAPAQMPQMQPVQGAAPNIPGLSDYLQRFLRGRVG